MIKGVGLLTLFLEHSKLLSGMSQIDLFLIGAVAELVYAVSSKVTSFVGSSPTSPTRIINEILCSCME